MDLLLKKPRVLYHASQDDDIKIFEPRSLKKPKEFKQGPVVWATDDLSFVTEFIVPTNDSWTSSGAYNDICYFVCSDKERFLREDKGGTIYELPSDTFKRWNRKEWFSKVSVKPIRKKFYPSGFEAMLENRVQIYFLDKDTFTKFTRSDYLKHLKNQISENQKLGVNVRKLA